MSTSEWINWIKLSPKYWLAIALVATALICLPLEITGKLGVAEFVDKYRMWIGFVCVVSWGFLFTHLMCASKDSVLGWWRKKRLVHHGREALQNLSPPEKRMLAEYLIFETKSRKQDFQSGIVHELKRANILYQACSEGTRMTGFAFNLHPWAWEELQAHPELLEPELDETQEKIEPRRRRRF
jgi:hypothetical protein